MNVGLQLLAKVLEIGELGDALSVERIFESGQKPGWQFIKKHHEKYCKVPSVQIFRENFPEQLMEYRFDPGWTESFEELIGLARERLASAEISDLVGKVIDLHDEKKIFEAQNLIASYKPATFGAESILGGGLFADLPDTPASYRIENILPMDGNVLFSAERKAGKTTTVLNLIRSLTSNSDPFLTAYRCSTVAGRVYLLDFELSSNTLRQWAADAGVDLSSDKIRVASLRGKAARFDITSPAARRTIAAELQEADTEVLIVDPVSPVLAALGIDESDNSGVRRFLEGITALSVEAGISSVILVHHTGWNATGRARGASAWEDWPDAAWNLKKEDGSRIFSAYGRDVSASGPVSLIPGSKELEIGNAEEDPDLAVCMKALKDQGSLSVRSLHEKMRELGYSGNREKLGKQLSTWQALDVLGMSSGGKGHAVMVELLAPGEMNPREI